MESAVFNARNEIFQQLKPHCIELSQLALKNDGSQSSTKALIQSTDNLLHVLRQRCRRNDGAFDNKLADYVFFPLSQILQKKKTYADSLSESTIKCLNILLEYGWKRSIALDLAKQLVILLTFVAGGVPGKTTEPSPEELVIEAYKALAALFRDLNNTPGGAVSLIQTSTVPALGHCMAVVLDGITDGPSPAVQIQALQTLDAVWHCVKDIHALSSFLPGTASALTKCLMPTTANRRSHKTIITALEVFGHVLTSILSDIRTGILTDAVVDTSDIAEPKTLTKSWLKATTAQIKLALSNVIRLRSHESMDVRKCLKRLALTILDECHDTLSESALLLVETCMTLSGIDSEVGLNRTTTLNDLAMIHPDIGEMMKGAVYNWATSLPRIMQSNDENAKHTTLNQLSKAHELLTDLGLNSSVLEDALVNSLRDSVTVTVDTSTSTKVLKGVEFDLNSQAAMTLVSDSAAVTKFRPIIMPETTLRETRSQLINLLSTFGTMESQIKMATEMLEYAREATGPSQLSAYWLSAQLLRSVTASNEDLDEFINSSLTLSDSQNVVNQELFSYSLSKLSGTDDEESDWRVQAIALEVMADTAQHMKEGFRTELVDVLYPVTQLLGSSNFQLREHAITSLSIISKSCGYISASELIIDNVDYMVNAISLRLNTFDISPQAPQVMVMIIRLTGPSLLLYLDDVVGSIFAALDNFHGYHGLVEILFSVLGEIVDVGSKSGQIRIESGSTIEHRKHHPPAPTINEIIALITKTQKSHTDHIPHGTFPKKPWKAAKTLLDEAEAPTNKEEEEDDQNSLRHEIEKPPPTKTYTMVQSIARLGQHYLTNPSPVLRAKLLGLVSTACAALHNNEDEFLPLVNDIWPVVVGRISDDEPFVTIAACDAVAEICRCAGDFMGTRVHDEWGGLMKLARQAKGRVAVERKGLGGRGIYSQDSQTWEGVVRLLTAIVGYVRIEDEMFDEVLETLGHLIPVNEEVRDSLSAVNADAVWLAMQLAGKSKPIESPVMVGYSFASADSR